VIVGKGLRRETYPDKLRDIPSRDESIMKRRDQLKKIMIKHYVSIVATDETVTMQTSLERNWNNVNKQ
jgi:hypothetical protein